MQGSQATYPLAAVGFMLTAMIMIGFIDNFIGGMAAHIGLWQFLFMRACLSMPLILVAAWLGAGSLRAVSLGRVVLRSGLIAGGMALYFGALAFMSIGEALAGLFTSPIFILLISIFFLKVRIGIWRVLAVVTGFAGVVMVLQPGGSGFSALMLMPVAGGLLYGLGNLVTRYLCVGESTMVMLTWIFVLQGVLGAAGLGVLAVAGPEVAAPGAEGFLTRGWVWPPDAAVWPVMAMQVLVSLVALFCLTRAYQLGEASYVAVFEYSIMVFGPGFGFLLFAETLGPVQLIGVVMIIAAGAIIALRSKRDAASVPG